MEEDDGGPPEAEPSAAFLRAEDEAFVEEDAERNAEQAERNARMRDMLRLRRAKKDGEAVSADAATTATAPAEEFMSCPPAGAARAGGGSSASAGVTEGAATRQPPWFVARPNIESVVLRLHEELLDFSQFMKHTEEEVLARRRWVQTISTACKAMWPGCKIRVFGSFFTGLSLPNGDVDVAVTDVSCKPATAMKMLADHLLARGEISWLEIIESAKVPVVKLRSQSCGLRADVVFNKPDGIETSQFVRDRMKEFPQLRPLVTFLKYFLLQRGLHETYTGGMGSYLLCNVVLHFIQRHPSLRNQRQYKVTSLGHLLYDLLKYYGQEFRYESTGISLDGGGYTFPKADRGWQRGGSKGGAVKLCLMSPLDSSVDLGAPVYRMAVLRNLFHHAFHCICHLFVTRSPPEVSTLCPLLLDPMHPVITDRYTLMVEQPVALPGLPRASDNATPVAAAVEVPVAEELDALRAELEEDPTPQAEEETAETVEEAVVEEETTSSVPCAKKRRKSAGGGSGKVASGRATKRKKKLSQDLVETQE